MLAFLGSHGFPENADRMAESIHKNRIYSIARNTMKFVNLWMNKKKSVTKFESRYELVYVNIKTQKYGLNMNPACSVSLGMYEWHRGGFVYHTNTEAHMNLR